MQLNSLLPPRRQIAEDFSQTVRRMRDRGRAFGITTDMTARVTVWNDAILAFADFHGLVIVADLQEVSGHHIQRRAGIEDVAVRVNNWVRRGITFEAFEVPDGAQDFHV